MKKALLTLAVAIAAVFSSGCSENNSSAKMSEPQQETMTLGTSAKPPVAKKVPYEMTAHGDIRVDDYYWMRDDSRTDEAVITHLEKENTYAKTVLAPLAAQTEALYEEMIARIPKDDSSVPHKENGYWYVTHYKGGGEYPVFVRKQSLGGEETELLNGNKMAEGHSYFHIGGFQASPDNTMLAYSVDTVSRRMYDIYVKNIESGELVADKLSLTSGSVYWANDNKTLYYIKKDQQTLLGSQVYRHTLGTDQADDELIFEQTDPTFYTYLGNSKNNDVIYIYQQNTDKSGVMLIDNREADSKPLPFFPIEDDLDYSIEKHGDEYFILTNWQAKNFRIMKVAVDKT